MTVWIPDGFEYVQPIKADGMGEVHLIRELGSRRLLALKRILPTLTTNDFSKQLFLREMQLLSDVSHKNVVAIEGISTESSELCYWMEFCDGGDARAIAPLSVDEALSVVLDVLEGLEYLEGATVTTRLADGTVSTYQGIVHRDLKPANVLFSGSGTSRTAKIADFGLSKAFEAAGLSGMTVTGDCGGTYAFICRKQLRDYKYAGPEVDVWAAAAVLYFLLTDSLPREFPSTMTPDAAVAYNDPVPIGTRRSDVPDPLASLIDAVLSGDDQPVFQTSSELKQEVQRVQSIL